MVGDMPKFVGVSVYPSNNDLIKADFNAIVLIISYIYRRLRVPNELKMLVDQLGDWSLWGSDRRLAFLRNIWDWQSFTGADYCLNEALSIGQKLNLFDSRSSKGVLAFHGMSSSAKALEPAFQGAGQRLGTEIWRNENFQLVPLPKSEYAMYYSIGGGVASGFTKPEEEEFETRLYVCKGKRVVRLKQERAKALEVIQFLKDKYHEGTMMLQSLPDDGKLNTESDSGEFWVIFGGFAPISKKVASEDDVIPKKTPPKQYRHLPPTPSVLWKAGSLPSVLILGFPSYDGKLNTESDSGEFWVIFGGFAPISKKVASEDDVIPKKTPPKQYRNSSIVTIGPSQRVSPGLFKVVGHVRSSPTLILAHQGQNTKRANRTPNVLRPPDEATAQSQGITYNKTGPINPRVSRSFGILEFRWFCEGEARAKVFVLCILLRSSICFDFTVISRYVMYKLHTSAIGNDDNKGNLTAVFELPSEKYPCSMGSFALGSRIYLLGGEVGFNGEVDITAKGGRNTQRLSEKVYFFDTAVSISSSSPLSVAPHMEGGKRSPLAIHVDGMIYVISALPSLYTYYSEEEPLFEVFDPQGNEGEGEWSSLPRPPFYRRSSNHGSTEINGAGMIVSHAVVGHRIFFFTTKKEQVDVFDVYKRQWTPLKVCNGCDDIRLPFKEAVMPIFDSAWAAIGTSIHRRSPINTFNLTADFGLVGRDVEGLETIRCTPKPPLAYGIYYHVLDMGNGWVCLLKFGNDKEGFANGKSYIFATVFHLVKKRMDKVSFDESKYWLEGQRLLPLPPPSTGVQKRDHNRVIGEIQVFGAEELRSSLFAPGLENYNTSYAAVGCFVM
ncbi:hypothetical protein RHMOL_Rhmol03G0027200 [Rhododendron molle]|uniref:Uncharacterized protein n=1 Tax=Rhododendron molle TaxID=49168 RepID=A0ACC0PAY7_RHOML|nr:hypothetical protein RHMOL_Rhmol03G0027200 [Rhododendron molle]